MVKKPEPTKEQFRLLKEQIYFWDKAIERSKEMLAHDKAARKISVNALKKLEKRYAE